MKSLSIMTAQTKRLDTLGMGISQLREIRHSNGHEGFLTSLKEKEVRSKLLRESC